ncbi:PH domain containing protein, partial [Pseudohyphozyma bogoriensis]
RTDIKTHIQAMEKEVSKLADVVLKERESTVVHLSHLSRALHPPPIPSGLNTPPNISPNDDPFLHNITVETQLRAQTVKENELLALVQSWQEKSEKLEKDVWQKVNDAWSVWQVGNSTMLLENQQRSMFLSANVDSVHPDAEWTHFQKLNYLIPRDLPATPLDDIEHVHKGDPQTIAIRSGVLERQKRFLKTWNAAHFILTPAGNLHEYKSSDSPLDKPVVSLHLPACIIGPMPTPEPSTKGRQLDAMFTIEGPDSRNVFRAKSWEELSSWWVEIDQFTKKLPLPDDPSTPVDEDEADIGQALKAEKAAAGEEEEPKTPPALPPRKEDETRSPPALPPRAANRLSGGLPAPIDTDLAPAEADIGTPTAEEPHHEPEESDISLHDDGDDSAPPAPIETEAPDSPSLSSPTSPVQGDGDVPEHSLHAQ